MNRINIDRDIGQNILHDYIMGNNLGFREWGYFLNGGSGPN
jgi:hypothetical protein